MSHDHMSRPMFLHFLFASTPLLWEWWESALREAGLLDRFSDVPLGIHFGFSLGVSSVITQVFSPPNHKSALENESFVTTQINKEVALSRYSSPLPPALFLGKYALIEPPHF